MDRQRIRGPRPGSLDQEAADLMLSGAVGPQDAPAEWRRVAELLGSARAQGFAPAGASGRDGRDRETIRSMVAILAEAPARLRRRRRWVPVRPSVPRPLTVFRVRLATALVAAVLAFLVGLASAGRLPGPAQNAVSVALSKFGITIPRHSSGPGSTTPVGPDLTGPAKKGLCTAYFAGKGDEQGNKLGAVPFKKLQDAAVAAGQSVEQFCADFVPKPEKSPKDNGNDKEHGQGNAKGKDKEKSNNGKHVGQDSEPHGHANGASKGD